jgi:hypothetical protein
MNLRRLAVHEVDIRMGYRPASLTPGGTSYLIGHLRDRDNHGTRTLQRSASSLDAVKAPTVSAGFAAAPYVYSAHR